MNVLIVTGKLYPLPSNNANLISKLLPYLSKFLGHSSPSETFYYYHTVQEAFRIIRKKDKKADAVISEVLI